MKKKLIVIIGALALLIGGFAAGTYAAKAGWLTFTGDKNIAETTDHTDEIMEILRQVNADKISAEEALAELEALNPPGLVRQIKELKGEVAELKAEIERLKTELAQAVTDNAASDEYIAHLEAELQRANTKVVELNGKTTEAVEEAREILEGGR